MDKLDEIITAKLAYDHFCEREKFIRSEINWLRRDLTKITRNRARAKKAWQQLLNNK